MGMDIGFDFFYVYLRWCFLSRLQRSSISAYLVLGNNLASRINNLVSSNQERQNQFFMNLLCVRHVSWVYQSIIRDIRTIPLCTILYCHRGHLLSFMICSNAYKLFCFGLWDSKRETSLLTLH